MNISSALDRDNANSEPGLETEADDGATAPDSVTRTQELPGPMAGRRRRFTSEEKRQFITQAMGPGESMSSVGRRHGLSVSLLFRWRRQLDSDALPKATSGASATRNDARDLRDRVRELERLLGRKTLEVELLQQELSRLGHNPGATLSVLDAAAPRDNAAPRR
jgi:transposase